MHSFLPVEFASPSFPGVGSETEHGTLMIQRMKSTLTSRATERWI